MTADISSNWKTLSAYIKCMHAEVSRWESFLLGQKIDWFSNEDIRNWFVSISNTLNILEELHIYDDISSLSINTESSGFPEIRHLYEIDLLSDYPPSLASVSAAKQNFVDDLFVHNKASIPMLERVAKATAVKLYKSSEYLSPFKLTSLRQMETDSSNQAFVCTWERYISQPLPMKYVMLFEASSKWTPSGENLEVLLRVLCEDTSLIHSLRDVVEGIDRSNALIYPKWLGRIVLGPVFISNLTNDDQRLQQALDRIAEPGEHITASRIIYEYIVSEDENDVSTVIDPQGIRHQKLQKYAVRKDGEYMSRGVTHLEKHLFAPHRVIQELDPEYRKEIGHTLNSY